MPEASFWKPFLDIPLVMRADVELFPYLAGCEKVTHREAITLGAPGIEGVEVKLWKTALTEEVGAPERFW